MHRAIIAYLGIHRHELIQQLKAGKTLARIADSTPGKSSAGLREVVVKAITAKVSAAIAATNLDKKVQAKRSANSTSGVAPPQPHPPLGGHHPAPDASKAPVPSG